MIVDLSRPQARPRAADRLDVVIAALSSDAHTWNLVFIQLLLEELGHRVRNLGPCVPDHLIVQACCSPAPDLLVVTSINGHGLRDGQSLIRAVRACPGLISMPTAIGGALSINGTRLAGALLAAGFDAVFEGIGADTSFRAYVNALQPTREG
jgi:methylaspartate mutase sigma subunit